MSRYKISFDTIMVTNRWKYPKYRRTDNWCLVGISKRWFGPEEFEWIISLFGLDIRIWFKREFIKEER